MSLPGSFTVDGGLYSANEPKGGNLRLLWGSGEGSRTLREPVLRLGLPKGHVSLRRGEGESGVGRFV